MSESRAEEFRTERYTLWLLSSFMNHDAIQDEEFVTVFNYALRKCNHKRIIKKLLDQYNDIRNQNIIKAIAFIDQPQRDEFIKTLIPISYKFDNIAIIFELQKTDTKSVDQAIALMPAQEQAQLKSILSKFTSDDDAKSYSSWMAAYTHGIGNIDYQAGLMTCSQIQAKKPYRFKPTILANIDEYKDYISFLYKRNKSINAKFIVTGAHWLAGVININEKKQVNIIIFDSLGSDPDDELYRDVNIGILDKTVKLLYYARKTFPQANIYFSCDKRQNETSSCQVFAIDDLTHLFTLRHNLGKTYRKTGLFGYLADHVNSLLTLDYNRQKFTVFECALPLSLLRTKQSRQLLQDISERSLEEQQSLVNKKKQTAYQSAITFFRPDPLGKLQNTRIDERFRKLTEHNREYLLKTDMSTVKSKMDQFTLAGFKSRHTRV